MITKSFKFKISAYMLAATVVLLPLAACSDDDDVPAGAYTASRYWSVPSSNKNMPSAGILIAQYKDAPTTYDISKLIDADPSTHYRTAHQSYTITFNGNNATEISKYSLTSASDSPEADPKSWTLEASTDERSWKELDAQNGITFQSRGETKTFYLDNEREFRYYRLHVTENNGAAFSQLAEFVLAAAVTEGENVDDVIAKSHDNTYSADYPLGTMHQNDLPASDADIAWLKDPSKEPATYGNLVWKTFDIVNIYPFGDPKPADVNQHAVGDCCALSLFAEMAYLYPKYIKEIIKPGNNSYSYIVTMFDPNGKKVEVGVDNSFVADGDKLGACSGKTDNVTWATLLEKALMKWCQVYKGSSDISGIDTHYVTPIFTGSGTTYAFRPGDVDAEELRRAIVSLLQQRQLIIGGFKYSDLHIDGKYLSVNYHAYSFMLPPSDKYVYVMRNPWGLLPLISGGYTDGKEDGLLNIENDGIVPLNIDIRVCNPGEMRKFAEPGSLMPYTPPSYRQSPMHVKVAAAADAPIVRQ